MTDQMVQFTGGIPENYDRGLGPHIFVDYAADIARRTAATDPRTVLEVAAGSGIVTRRLRDALPDSAHLTASDLNGPMLEIAKEKFQDGEAVDFQTADATALPFGDGIFDTVVCQFGVMFFPDKDQAYREVLRCLKPAGHYIFNVWDSFAYNPFAQIAQETIARFFPADPPGFYKLPFSYHRVDPIKESLIAAGFTGIAVHVLPLEKEIPQAEVFARGIVYGNPTINEIRSRGAAKPDEVMAAVTENLQKAFGPDPGRMPLQAIVISARKP